MKPEKIKIPLEKLLEVLTIENCEECCGACEYLKNNSDCSDYVDECHIQAVYNPEKRAFICPSGHTTKVLTYPDCESLVESLLEFLNEAWENGKVLHMPEKDLSLLIGTEFHYDTSRNIYESRLRRSK